MINNPYIEKVSFDWDIFSETEEIYSHKWNWKQFFKNDKEIYLEIWTWFGHFFSLESSHNLDKNFIWMEIKFKRLFKTAEKTRALWAKDFVLLKDFGQNINQIFGEWEVSRTYVFFPDPWDKKDRQKKHKLLQLEFIQKLHNITKDWWEFFFKTDHLWYFEDVLEIVKNSNLWDIRFISNDYEVDSDKFDKKKITEFESMYRWKKVKINYVEFVKI